MLAEADANVLEVEHVRTDATLELDEVEIALQLETKGAEHCDAGAGDAARRRATPSVCRLSRSEVCSGRGRRSIPLGRLSAASCHGSTVMS